MGRARRLAALLLVNVVVGVGTQAPPGRAESSRPDNRGGWSAVPLSGIPPEAQLWDVAVRDGIFVATGGLDVIGPGGNEGVLVVWRSSDGISWTEVHHEEYLQNIDGAPPAQVASGPSGFAIVGGSCDGYHCRPMALTSADGRAWVAGDVRRHGGVRAATVDVAYEGAALLDVIDSGGWVAVGWAQAGSYDAEPAVWRSRDAGATWNPVPPEGIPAGGSRADHMERVIAWNGWLLVMGMEQNQGGGIGARLWLSAGGDEWRYADGDIDASFLTGVASLGSGEAFLSGSAGDFGGAVWRSDTDGRWEGVSDPELATLAWTTGLKAGRTGLVLLGVDRGSAEPGMPSADLPALWGSPDGIHWLQTLRLEHRAAGLAVALPTPERWFVYGATGEGGERRPMVWTTVPRCATGGAICPSG